MITCALCGRNMLIGEAFGHWRAEGAGSEQVVCKLCEKACPSDCITVEGLKPEAAKRKTVTKYRLDFTKCSLCGSCVEACRDGAIRFSREYNLASTSKEEFIMDLFQRLEAEHGQQSQSLPPAKVEMTAPPAATPSTGNSPDPRIAAAEQKIVAVERKVEAT